MHKSFESGIRVNGGTEFAIIEIGLREIGTPLALDLAENLTERCITECETLTNEVASGERLKSPSTSYYEETQFEIYADEKPLCLSAIGRFSRLSGLRLWFSHGKNRADRRLLRNTAEQMLVGKVGTFNQKI